MSQQKVRTADVVEILDVKIHASQAVPPLAVVAGETYDQILDQIDLQILTPAEKQAIDATLSSPSATNPVVLRDDVQTYHGADSFGDIKDGVDLFSQLPGIGNVTGDLRPVFTDGILYRWSGAAWLPFITTGTLDHTQLTNLNGNPVDTGPAVHLQAAQLALQVAQAHAHANAAVLDAIVDQGSGLILSSAERALIPTADQKAALAGTFGTPSLVNRYVTNLDPRLNTVKNPYVTLGFGATVQLLSADDLQAAVENLGTIAPEVRAYEVYPATTNMNAGNFNHAVYDVALPLLVESIAPGGAIWQFKTFTDSFQIAPGPGQVTIRGITFELTGANTRGLLVERDNTLIENCTFRAGPGAVLADALAGLTVVASGCTIRRCRFDGLQGLRLTGQDHRVIDCTFDAPGQLALESTGDRLMVYRCGVDGAVQILGGADVQLANCTFDPTATVSDAGTNTRFLSCTPEQFGQPVIGALRTVGPVGSYADFRSTDQLAFISALADPHCQEVEVLQGSWTFTAAVSVPADKKIRAVQTQAGDVQIAGTNLFILGDHAVLAGLTLVATGLAVQADGLGCEIRRCVVNAAQGISATGSTDLTVQDCQIVGQAGILVTGGTRTRIEANLFQTSGSPLGTTGAVTGRVADNRFLGCSPGLGGTDLLVTGNQFLGALPSKLATLTSLWVGNYPATANNPDGIDHEVVPLDLNPLDGTGAQSEWFGAGTVTFGEVGQGVTTMLATPLPRVDQTQGFTITLMWTSPIFSGSVPWEATCCFRSRTTQQFGAPVVGTVVAPRTQLLMTAEETSLIVFPASYGIVDPTHVSVQIRRLTQDPADTLNGSVHLTEAHITVARN